MIIDDYATKMMMCVILFDKIDPPPPYLHFGCDFDAKVTQKQHKNPTYCPYNCRRV